MLPKLNRNQSMVANGTQGGYHSLNLNNGLIYILTLIAVLVLYTKIYLLKELTLRPSDYLQGLNNQSTMYTKNLASLYAKLTRF